MTLIDWVQLSSACVSAFAIGAWLVRLRRWPLTIAVVIAMLANLSFYIARSYDLFTPTELNLFSSVRVLLSVLIIAAIIGTAFSFWSQRRYRAAQTAVTFTQADSTNVADALKLKSEYKADLKDLRSELEIEHTARRAVEVQLEAANKIIAQLQDRDNKREAAMVALQAEFDRDTALRVNIDRMLSIANQRIDALENERAELNDRLNAAQSRISALEDELGKRDARIRELEANQRPNTSGGLIRR